MLNDKLEQNDAIEIRCECGHPNVKPGETCTLCGVTLPQGDTNESTKKEE